MATDKKSFVLYCDVIHTVKKLSNEDAGLLFKHILSYVNDEDPITDNLLLEVVFEPIKQQLKRDLVRWENETKKRSDAGKKGMEARWNKKSITKDNTVINDITVITDTVNDTVKVNDILDRDIKFKNEIFKHNQYSNNTLNDFYNYWSEKTPNGKKMKFEMQKTFEIKKRLVTWQKNENNFKPKEKEKFNWAKSIINT